MPDRQQLYSALLKADAAGDTAGAKVLADYIRSLPAEEAAPPDVSAAESAFRGAVQGGSLSFGDEISAGVGAGLYGVAKGVRSLLPGGVPEDAPGVGEVYTSIRDELRAENAAAQEANPVAFGAGEVGGVLATGGVNPVSVARAGGRSLLALGTREAYTLGAARAAATQAGRGSLLGAGYGAATGAGASEAETLGGVVSDAAEGAVSGATAGAVVGGLLGAGSSATAQRATRAADDVGKAVAAERENALLVTGLDGKQKTLGGPKRAKERAQALYDEPSPTDPSKRLVEEAKALSPDQRLELASGLRREAGAQLGEIRDALTKVEGAQVPVAPLREQVRGAFSQLPSEVQAKALEQVDGMIAQLAKDGSVSPAALRKLIEDSEGLAKFGTPNLEAALGNARGRVFQAARAVLVQAERDLIAQALPERVGAYNEALRKYGVYSDFELGSKVILERANKGQKTIREPKREPDGSLRGTLLRAAGGEVGARIGSMLPTPGSAYVGARAGEAIAERWSRWAQPTVASTSARVKKLERLQPMMEEALRKGPAEVARVHALFMQRSPDYRKAIEAGD